MNIACNCIPLLGNSSAATLLSVCPSKNLFQEAILLKKLSFRKKTK